MGVAQISFDLQPPLPGHTYTVPNLLYLGCQPDLFNDLPGGAVQARRGGGGRCVRGGEGGVQSGGGAVRCHRPAEGHHCLSLQRAHHDQGWGTEHVKIQLTKDKQYVDLNGVLMVHFL